MEGQHVCQPCICDIRDGPRSNPGILSPLLRCRNRDMLHVLLHPSSIRHARPLEAVPPDTSLDPPRAKYATHSPRWESDYRRPSRQNNYLPLAVAWLSVDQALAHSNGARTRDRGRRRFLHRSRLLRRVRVPVGDLHRVSVDQCSLRNSIALEHWSFSLSWPVRWEQREKRSGSNGFPNLPDALQCVGYSWLWVSHGCLRCPNHRPILRCGVFESFDEPCNKSSVECCRKNIISAAEDEAAQCEQQR